MASKNDHGFDPSTCLGQAKLKKRLHIGCIACGEKKWYKNINIKLKINSMIAKERYNELEKLCDKYFEIDAELDNLIEQYNKSSIEDFRNDLLPQIGKKIMELDNSGETYVKEVNKEADDLVRGIDLDVNVFINNMYRKTLSNVATDGDTSRYNRLNRLKELDRLVDQYRTLNP